MRYLAHKDLLVREWPYFKRLIESGLSEAKTQLVELSLSPATVELLLKALYTDSKELLIDTALEVIECGPQIGLFESLTCNDNIFLPTNALPLFKELIQLALKFLARSNDVRTLNLAHALGFHDHVQHRMRLDAFYSLNGDGEIVAIAPLINKNGLHPDIAAAYADWKKEKLCH